MTQTQEIAFQQGIADATKGNLKNNPYFDQELKSWWEKGVYEYLDSKRYF